MLDGGEHGQPVSVSSSRVMMRQECSLSTASAFLASPLVAIEEVRLDMVSWSIPSSHRLESLVIGVAGEKEEELELEEEGEALKAEGKTNFDLVRQMRKSRATMKPR